MCFLLAGQLPEPPRNVTLAVSGRNSLFVRFDRPSQAIECNGNVIVRYIGRHGILTDLDSLRSRIHLVAQVSFRFEIQCHKLIVNTSLSTLAVKRRQGKARYGLRPLTKAYHENNLSVCKFAAACRRLHKFKLASSRTSSAVVRHN
jgi:hypothetical protein